MSLFNRKPTTDAKDRLPATCLGEACPNYKSQDCSYSEMEWLSAGAPTKDRDLSKPPHKEEANYLIYGQRCLAAADGLPRLVAQRVEVYQPEEVSIMALIALTGRYGDMPVSIVYPGQPEQTPNQINTVASSE